MKTLITLILTFFLTVSQCFSQNLFQKVYPDWNGFEPWMDVNDNGEIYWTGDVYQPFTTNRKVVVQRLDQDGNVLLNTGFFPANTGSCRPNKCLATSDGGVLISGRLGPGLGSRDSSFFIKLSPTGTIEWSKTFHFGTNNTYSRVLLETADNGFLLAGHYESSTNVDGVFLIKTDASGNVQWKKGVVSTIPGTFYETGGVQQTSNGDYLLFGVTRLFSEGSWVARISSAGDILWAKLFKTHDLTSFQPKPWELFQRPNGDLDFIYNMPFTTDEMALVILRTDSSGNFKALKRYNTDDIDEVQVCGVTADGAGGYAMSGPGYDETTEAFAFRVDANLDLLWAARYNTPGIEASSDIIATADGGFLMSGAAQSDTLFKYRGGVPLNPWLVKMDGNGYNPCFHEPMNMDVNDTTITILTTLLDTVPVPGLVDKTFIVETGIQDSTICEPTGIDLTSKTQSFQIYPNPGKDMLFIDLGNQSNLPVHCVIYSTNGQIVWNGEIVSSNLVVDVSKLSKGPYWISVIDDWGNKEGQLWIKQQ